ncbi:MAG: 50S ribosomal protein L1 [bacterium]
MAKKIEDIEETISESVEAAEVTDDAVATEEVLETIGDAAVENELKAEKATAKAGKRSTKAVKEAEAEAEKEARKEIAAEKAEAPKVQHKPHVKKFSKNQKAMREAINADMLYGLTDAVALLQKISTAKFDPALELHVRLDIDPRQADQMVRASTALPAGTGKSVRIAVLSTDAKKSEAAKAAGADLVDSEQLLADITKGILDFEVLVATPDMMPQLGRHAKTLGPKGLMPSPKSGTVTADPAAAVKEIKQGRLEIRNDANGIIHVAVGKLSFKTEDLVANAKAVLQCVQANRPSGVKGTYVKTITMAASMTPGVKLDPIELTAK